MKVLIGLPGREGTEPLPSASSVLIVQAGELVFDETHEGKQTLVVNADEALWVLVSDEGE